MLGLQQTAGNRAATKVAIQRFESFEHVQLGEAGGNNGGFVLLACHARDLPNHAGEPSTWPPEWRALHARGTPTQRRMLSQGLSYGEILALSGDMYASVDPVTGGTDPVRSFALMNQASLREIYDLLPLMRGEATTGQLEAATGGRYLVLAKQNLSHFSNVTGGRNNLATWRRGHAAAIEAGRAGDPNTAWGLSATADHFLTDAFSSGHMRQDREALTRSSSGQAAAKHDHDVDNEFGVHVHNRRGDRWVAYGDEHLNDAPDARNRAIAIEAVQLSRADITAALAGGHAYPAPHDPVDLGAEPGPMFASIESLVPIADGPTERSTRDSLAEWGHLAVSELPGQLTPDGDTVAREWVARQPEAALRDMPMDERVRMLSRLFSGNFSAEDDAGAQRLVTTTPPAQMRSLSTALDAGPILSLDIGDRTRYRVMMSH